MPHRRRLLNLSALVILFVAGCEGRPAAAPPAPSAPTANAPTANAPTANAPTAPAANAPTNPHTPPPTAQPSNTNDPRPPSMGFGGPPKPLATPSLLGQSPTEVKPSGQTRLTMIEGLQFDVPTEWQDLPSTSPMRLAQMIIPGPGGNAEVALFRFPGGAGTVEQNVTRWAGQFTAPDGSTPTPKSEVAELGGLSVTTVTLEGTYIAPVSPRDPSNRFNEPNWAMLGVIVQGAGDPYFFKIVGPAATLTAWQPALVAFAKSFRVAA